MRTNVYNLPNGFLVGDDLVTEVELRKLDGDDEDFLLDKDEVRQGMILDRLLKRCIVRLGQATEPEIIGKLYDECLLMADSQYLLIQLRRWSVQDKYSFDMQCPKCDSIGLYHIDLSTLRIDQAPEKSRGQRKFIDVLTYDGEASTVEHRPLFVRDGSMLEIIRKQYKKEKATRELFLQTVSIDGGKPDIKALKKYPLGWRNALRGLMDSKVGGVDMELLSTCSECNRQFKESMPIAVKSFFFQAGDSLNSTMARPFRSSGLTSTSSESDEDGALEKSAS